MMSKFKQNWLILLIVGLALFARLYRLPATMTFLEDEGRDLLIVKRMIDTHKPVLIGPQTSMGNMYLGPLYYYFITPALLLTRMDPIGPAILIALTGSLTTYLLYILGKRWFGKFAGIISAVLYAVLPMLVYFTRNSWNPNLVPLVTVLSLYVLDVLLFHKDKVNFKHWLSLGLIFGLMVQLHYMILVFIAWEALIIAISYLRDFRKLLVGIAISLVGFIIAMSPFIVFELRNNFVNTHAIQKFVAAKDDQSIRYSLPLWLWESKVSLVSQTGFGNILGKGFFVTDPARPYLAAIFFGLTCLVILAARSKQNKWQFIIPSVLVLGPLFSLGIYQENIHPHYLAFFYPLLPLIFGAALNLKPLRYPTLLFAAFVLIWSTPTLFSYLNSGPTVQVERAKRVASYIADKAGSRPYNVVSRSGTYTSPYQYFLSLVPNRPSTELQETVFLICQDSPCTESNVSTTLLFLAGSSHPTIDAYLGHPAINEFRNPRELVSGEHVFNGVWVDEIKVAK